MFINSQITLFKGDLEYQGGDHRQNLHIYDRACACIFISYALAKTFEFQSFLLLNFDDTKAERWDQIHTFFVLNLQCIFFLKIGFTVKLCLLKDGG